MPQDLDLMQGSWSVTALEVDGQPMPDEMLAEGRIVVKGERFVSSGMGAVYEGTLVLDASVAPPRIDMRFDAGPSKGNTNPGIYELSGETLRICIAMRGNVRPGAFATSAGSGIALETLIRGDGRAARPQARKPAKAAPKVSGSAPTELEGEWQLLSGFMTGSWMEESLIKWVKRVTRRNLTTVYAGPQVMMRAEFTSDASKLPKTIDYLNLVGANKGKRQQGIYELKGDTLTIFVAAPGASRPTGLQVAPGDAGTLTVWKRG